MLGYGTSYLWSAVDPQSVPPAPPSSNIIAGALVLQEPISGDWYASSLETSNGDTYFLPPVLTSDPAPGTSPTVVILAPEDATKHELSVGVDAGGAVVLFAEQNNSGAAEDVIVLPSTDLADHPIFMVKDAGGIYMAQPQ